MTKAGVGKFVGVSKNPDGPDEEWSYTFTDCGLVLVPGANPTITSYSDGVVKIFNATNGIARF
jgi:hypothetical protein